MGKENNLVEFIEMLKEKTGCKITL